MYKSIGIAVVSLLLAGPVAGQESTSVEQVRALLMDIQDWPPDSAEIPTKMAKKWGKDRKAKKKYKALFKQGGAIESIQFLDTFRETDIYWIRFENARLLVQYARDADGTMVKFRSRPFGLKR